MMEYFIVSIIEAKESQRINVLLQMIIYLKSFSNVYFRFFFGGLSIPSLQYTGTL